MTSGQLTGSEIAQARATAQRLRSALRGIIERLPARDRQARAMARTLGVHRSTCQRVVAVCGCADDLEALLGAPGIAGLRQFIDAAAMHIDPGTIDAARAAVDKYDELIRRSGRSRSGMARRIALSTRAPAGLTQLDASEAEQRRRDLFDLACHYVDAHAETRLHTIIVGTRPDDGHTLEMGIINAYLGFIAGASGLPLMHAAFHQSSRDSAGCALIGLRDLDMATPEGRTPSAVLAEFSSKPLAVVSSRIADGRILQIIDPERTRRAQSTDVVTAFRISPAGTHPGGHETPFLRQLCFNGVPVKRLVFDCCLHRSLVRASVPSLAVFRPNPALPFGVFDRWFDRIGDAPPLNVLGLGRRAWSTSAYGRYEELVGHVFDRLGWPDNEFVLHRCDVTFPIWNVEYALMFDFSDLGLEPPMAAQQAAANRE